MSITGVDFTILSIEILNQLNSCHFLGSEKKFHLRFSISIRSGYCLDLAIFILSNDLDKNYNILLILVRYKVAQFYVPNFCS